MPPPRVSVVIATFDRAEVLRRAIESVRRSTIDDWELIVVGDHCTDHTADVVTGFGDPRIRWIDLPVNHGEQSAPNNVGVEHARADVVAFLNHDDLYFPDHLERSLAALDATGADLLYSLVAAVAPRTPDALEAGDLACRIAGGSPTGRYVPSVDAPASGWVLRRALHERLGGWRSGWRLGHSASQDFLFRAWRGRADLRPERHLGVLALPSSRRPGAYVSRGATEDAAEIDWYARRLQHDPALRERLLTVGAEALAGQVARDHFRLRLPKWRQLLYGPALRLGLNPRQLIGALKFGGRGGLYRHLYRTRGLETHRVERI